MITASLALTAIPSGLRDPLVFEYQSIVQNYLEHRWLPSELSGGRFSEIVYTILDGHAKKSYSAKPAKPADFVSACRKLENSKLAHVPRSFQILIPRLLPALYEIRNNRSVGHVGGDVDPNHMDSVAVLSMANWTMAELIRVFHNLTIDDAQRVVDLIAETKVPVVWSDGDVKRILNTSLRLPEQILLLVAVTVPDVSVSDLLRWSECEDRKHFMKTIRKMHKERLVEFTESTQRAKLLPPGSKAVEVLVKKKNLSNLF